MPGPPPSRSDKRKRKNTLDYEVVEITPENVDDLPIPVDLDPVWPQPKEYESWNPLVKEIWDRLRTDPSATWTSGAAMAFDAVMCEQLHRLLEPRVAGVIPASEHGPGELVHEKIPLTGTEMNGIMKWLSSIGVFEADRLRLHREITFYAQRRQEAEESDAALAEVYDIVAEREKALGGGA